MQNINKQKASLFCPFAVQNHHNIIIFTVINVLDSEFV